VKERGAFEFDWDLLVAADAQVGDCDDDTRLIRNELARARRFLESQAWCDGLGRVYWGGGAGGVCTIWLFEVASDDKGVDPWVWVIVGDLPSAYIRADTNHGPIEALKDYIEEMGRWVVAARYGKDVSALIPVHVEATPEMADLLDRKLGFLEREFVNSNRRLLP
jgi:hypothetical protein